MYSSEVNNLFSVSFWVLRMLFPSRLIFLRGKDKMVWIKNISLSSLFLSFKVEHKPYKAKKNIFSNIFTLTDTRAFYSFWLNFLHVTEKISQNRSNLDPNLYRTSKHTLTRHTHSLNWICDRKQNCLMVTFFVTTPSHFKCSPFHSTFVPISTRSKNEALYDYCWGKSLHVHGAGSTRAGRPIPGTSWWRSNRDENWVNGAVNL